MKKDSQKNGGFSSLIIIAWRNIWRNRRRTALCITAVGISVFFIIFMRSWINGMVAGIEEVIRTYETGHVSAVSTRFEADREYFPVQFPLTDGQSATELIQKVEAIDGVKAALPRITAYASLFDSKMKHAILWGIDIDREKQINKFNLIRKDDGIIEGRYPDPGKNECAVGKEFAKKTGIQIGDQVSLKTVSAQFSDKYWSPVVTGIFSFDYQKFDEDYIIVRIEKLQKILGLEDATQQLVVFAKNADMSSYLRNKVSAILGKESVVREWSDNYWVAMLRSMSGLYIIIFAVFQIVASFLIINTILMIIHERIKEIGMMGALGMMRREIVTVFFIEAVFLSILGAAAGLLIGGVGTFIGSMYPIDTQMFTGGGMKEFPMSGIMYLEFSVVNLLEGFFFGVVVSSLCTLIPSLKSAFIEPVEALRR